MKILTAFIKTLLFLFIVLILSALATFFLYVFLPENVQNAIEYFGKLCGAVFFYPAQNII